MLNRSNLTVVSSAVAAAVGDESVLEQDLLEIQKEMLDTINYVDKYSWERGNLGGLDWGMESLNKAFDGLNPGLIMIAGQPNVGKSALCMQLAWQISQANTTVIPGRKPQRAYVVYFSLDDNSTELLPRVIAIDQRVPINIVKSPKKYEDDLEAMTRRSTGIDRLKRSLDRFKIIDSTKGSSIEFIEKELERCNLELAKLTDPYKLVVFIDNFHDITVDAIKFGDNSNAKYDYVAGELSRICTQMDIPIICTAEFRKLNGNRRPIVDDIRETVKIGYEAKAILLCYNEVGLRGEAASVYYQIAGVPAKQPIFEVKIGKNKYGSYKGRMFFEFQPEMSRMNEVSENDTMRYAQMILG